MLDSDNFVKAGWVHGLRLFMYEESKFVVMGKVNYRLLVEYFKGQTLPKNVLYSPDAMNITGWESHALTSLLMV